MTHALTTLIDDNEGCGVFGLLGFHFSANAYTSMRQINNVCVNETQTFTEKTETSREYQTDFLQIFRHITTEVIVNDLTVRNTVSDYWDAVPAANPKTIEKLEDMARQYILNNWGTVKAGKIVGAVGHIYEEKSCPQITIPEPPGYCTSDSGCSSNQTCVANYCTDPCKNTHCLLPHEVCFSISL